MGGGGREQIENLSSKIVIVNHPVMCMEKMPFLPDPYCALFHTFSE